MAAAAWRRSRVGVATHVTLAIAAITGIATGGALFFDHHRTELGVAVLCGGALVLRLATVVRKRVEGAARDVDALVVLAFGIAACGGLFLLRGNAVAPAFAVAGAGLARAAAGRSRVAVASGWCFIGISALDVLFAHLPLQADVPMFANAEFLVALCPCVAAFVAAWPVPAGGSESAGGSERERGSDLALPSRAAAIVRAWAVGVAASLVAHEASRVAAHGLHGDARRVARDAAAAFGAAGASALVAVLVVVRRQFARVEILPFGPLVLATLLGLLAAGSDVAHDYQAFPGSLFLAASACAASLLLASVLGLVRHPAGCAAGLVFLVAVSCRIHAWGVHEGDWLLGQMWMSGAWAIYASALLVIGFWRKVAPARWAGIGLFFVTAAKVLIVDLSRLDTPARVGSFLVLGVFLVAASFLYQRLTRDPPTS